MSLVVVKVLDIQEEMVDILLEVLFAIGLGAERCVALEDPL